MKTVRVVILGGGTGPRPILKGLREWHECHITAIVAMSDSGGSTGRIRDEFRNVLPPGDLRNCICALSPDPILEEFMQSRFDSHNEIRELSGHNVGNVVITGLYNYFKDTLLPALEKYQEIMKVDKKHRVLPITLTDIHLIAEYADGVVLSKESDIDAEDDDSVSNRKLPIQKVSLDKGDAFICAPSAEAIENANIIILSAGSLYTSLAAVLLPLDVKASIANSSAKKICVANIMTQRGQTSGKDIDGKLLVFKLSHHLKVLEEYSGISEFDYVLVNNKSPGKDILADYEKFKTFVVECDLPESEKIIKVDLLSEHAEKSHLIRHDPDKLARAIRKIASMHF